MHAIIVIFDKVVDQGSLARAPKATKRYSHPYVLWKSCQKSSKSPLFLSPPPPWVVVKKKANSEKFANKMKKKLQFLNIYLG